MSEARSIALVAVSERVEQLAAGRGDGRLLAGARRSPGRGAPIARVGGERCSQSSRWSASKARVIGGDRGGG